MDLEQLEAECIKVSLTRGGRTVSAFVSSFHLVDEKRRGLEAAITRMAAEALLDDTPA